MFITVFALQRALKLYWSKGGTSLSWDSCWNGKTFPSTNVLMGNTKKKINYATFFLYFFIFA